MVGVFSIEYRELFDIVGAEIIVLGFVTDAVKAPEHMPTTALPTSNE